MAAFVIWQQTETTDRNKLDAYRKQVQATIDQHGGNVLGGSIPKAIEGAFFAERMVVVQFEHLDDAHAWYASDDYKKIRTLRHEGAKGNLIFVG